MRKYIFIILKCKNNEFDLRHVYVHMMNMGRTWRLCTDIFTILCVNETVEMIAVSLYTDILYEYEQYDIMTDHCCEQPDINEVLKK